MWLRTYRSLLDKTLEAEMLAHKACLTRDQRLLAQIEKIKKPRLHRRRDEKVSDP